MFNIGLKKDPLKNLGNAQNQLESSVRKSSMELHELRRKSSEEIITAVESYVNTLVNVPEGFHESFSVYKAEFKAFNDLLDESELRIKTVEANNAQAHWVIELGIVAMGICIAVFAKPLAMAIVTTFGKASTGTPIKNLSGAAVEKAALARLGGGALVEGGGGIATGKARLASVKSIGWKISETGLGQAIWSNKKKKLEKREEIELAIEALTVAEYEIVSLIDQTNLHTNDVNDLLLLLKEHAPIDYNMFTVDHKEKLASLSNHIQSLSKLLNKKVLND